MLQTTLWTDKNKAVAAQMWAENKTMTEIGDYFGASRNAISGLISRNRELFATRDGVAERKPPKPRKKISTAREWQVDELDTAQGMWTNGATINEMAFELECSMQAINVMTKRFPSRFPKLAPKPVIRERIAAEKQAPIAPVVKADIFDTAVYQIPGMPTVSFSSLGSSQCKFPLSNETTPRGALMPCCGAEATKGSYCHQHWIISRGRGSEGERTAHRVLARAAQ